MPDRKTGGRLTLKANTAEIDKAHLAACTGKFLFYLITNPNNRQAPSVVASDESSTPARQTLPQHPRTRNTTAVGRRMSVACSLRAYCQAAAREVRDLKLVVQTRKPREKEKTKLV